MRITRSRISERLILLVPLLVWFAVGAAADSLQGDMDAVLKADARNVGVVVHVHQASGDVLVYDLISVAGSNSMADVSRVLLQFAQAEQGREFKTVQLDFRGTPRFLLSGSYFRQLGQQFGVQNPVYTIRRFPENLMNPDGSRAYPNWSGGLIGVVGKQMEDSNDFHRRWWMNDLLSSGDLKTQSSPVSVTVADQTQPPTAATGNPPPQSATTQRVPPVVSPAKPSVPPRLPDWLAVMPDARRVAKTISAGEADIVYEAPAPAEDVVRFYRDRLTNSVGVEFQAGFNGIGTTIQALSDVDSCVIRIDEADAITAVSAKCSPKPSTPPRSVSAEQASTEYVAPKSPTIRSAAGPGIHHVEYEISGSARAASLTYKNASGGTEQNVVALPATLSFYAVGGAFAYISAQNKDTRGEVHVSIRVDGRLVQQATSAARYGIATASGSVSR